VFLQLAVEVVEDDARLDADGAAGDVVGRVMRLRRFEIDDEGGIDRLAALGGAAAARRGR
jgi:hypothetical protein